MFNMALSGFKANMAAKVKETAEESGTDVKPTTRKNGVGMGLLNSASQVERKVEEYPMIEIENILPNEKNKYEQHEIDDLMMSIKDVGLLQPLVGYYVSDGKVKLTTGHRRLMACKRLVEEGQEEYKRLPVKIKSVDDLDLDLSDDLKEKYLIIVTNNQRRNELSQAEMLFEVETLREIYAALKRKGKKPKGTTRELIAKDMGIDERTVARYTNISNAASEDVKNAFVNEEIDLQTTQELVKQPTEIQDKALEKISKENEKEKASGSKPVTGKKKAEKAIREAIEEESGEEEKSTSKVSITEKELNSAQKEIEKAGEVLASAVGKKISKEKKNFLFSDLRTLSGLLKEIEELLQ